MELKYSKAEVLTIYFNRAYLGAGTRGFEAAAQRYFGISANQVDPAQAAMLAGLLKAPSRFAPTNNLKRAQDRANVIVGLMQEQGYLTPTEADEARSFPAVLSPEAQSKSGGFFADWVMETAPDFLTSATTEDVIMRTTLDVDLQKKAEEALKFVFDTKVKEGSKAQVAIVVMGADGAVRAMVQRPRPQIFNGVMTDGKNIDLYTSFYSGHTSFVALAALSIFFMFQRNYPNQFPKLKTPLLFMVAFLITLTAALRVVGGRHYPTDTLGGCIAGLTLCIYFNTRFNQNRV
jgi:hypothetical protein